MNTALIKGAPVELAGDIYIIPPLTIGAIEDLQEEMAAMTSADPRAQFDAMAKVVHAAISRNYPDITIDTLKRDLLDLGNIFEVVDAVMGASGMVKRLGEPTAASASTGPASTPA